MVARQHYTHMDTQQIVFMYELVFRGACFN